MIADFDEAEARRAALADWEADSGGAEAMERGPFMDALFELADICAPRCGSNPRRAGGRAPALRSHGSRRWPAVRSGPGTKGIEPAEYAEFLYSLFGQVSEGIPGGEEYPANPWADVYQLACRCRPPCLRTASHLPPWTVGRRRPLQRNPQRSLSTLKACRSGA